MGLWQSENESARQGFMGLWESSDALNAFTFSVISTQTISGLLSTKEGTSVTVNWGDGTSNTYSGTDKAYSKDYGSVGNRTVVFTSGSGNLTKFMMTQAGANISFDLEQFPRSLTAFTCLGSNTITGNLSSLPAGLTYLFCGGYNTITGDLSSLPVGLTYFYCSGSNTITGNLSSLPTDLTYFQCSGSNTITGNLSSLPAVLTYFVCSGYNTITGNLSSLPAVMSSFNCTGYNTVADYSGKTWANNQRRVYHVPISGGGLSSAEVDQLLIDLASAGGTWSTEKQVYLKGTNAARTSASDAAVATLVSKGVTVTTT